MSESELTEFKNFQN